MKKTFILFRDSITGWLQNEAVLHAAALSYFTIFSLAPLLIISVAIAGIVFNQAAVAGLIVETLEGFVGTDVAVLVQDIILNSSDPTAHSVAAIIGGVVMLYGASIVFIRLQRALDAMWGIVPQTNEVRRGAFALIRTGLIAVVAALAVGFYLLALLLLQAIWIALPVHVVFHEILPNPGVLVPLISFVLAPVLYVLPFGLIYKELPRAAVRWRDVWLGAVLAAVLFWIGGNVIGLYLSYSGVTSIYGAAGSLVAFLIWVFYSAMVFLYGAKFTQVYADMYGEPVKPYENFTFKSDS